MTCAQRRELEGTENRGQAEILEPPGFREHLVV